MKGYLFSPINSAFVAQCHELNEKNVPNVGTKSLDGFINLVENSDYNECILKNNEVVGYVVCFQDNENTINYMHEIKHKNFMEGKFAAGYFEEKEETESARPNSIYIR